MTKIILEPKNQGDLILIKELAERLNIKYSFESLTSKQSEKRSHLKKIKKGVDVSNYGNPSNWQRKVRKDHKLNLPE